MEKQILGIHHVTAIAGEPQRNVDFYAGVLGLRMVKLTVNYDDPATYHLYYGDEKGTPGSIMTFFPWPGGAQGRHGTGQLSVTAFSVPHGTLGFWTGRLKSNGVSATEPVTRFDEKALAFLDPDGLRLELIESRQDRRIPWERGQVPPEVAIRGFHSVTLSEEGYERTAALLGTVMGFRMTKQSENRYRYEAGDGGPGSMVDVLCVPDLASGRVAVGTVHHVAWRTANDKEQLGWREDIAREGLNVTPVIDRKYFHSIYFREPGGVLFEIATDPPGFAVDEPVERLGSGLVLPPWLEPVRNQIQQALPPLRLALAGAP